MIGYGVKQSPSGYYVESNYKGKPYLAFVPAPLPPKLELDLELWRVGSEADRALSELAGLAWHLPNPYLLIRPFINREAVLSSRIEGTRADVEDLFGYEAGQKSGYSSSVSEVREVVNYARALEMGLDLVRDYPINLHLIRQLHGVLLEGARGQELKVGEFRNRQNWIGGATPLDAAYVPPPETQLTECLQDLERYWQAEQTHPRSVDLALIHYQFEAIHPFEDGNGRMGRLLISLLMVHWGLLPLPFIYPSAFFHKHRERYFDLLLAVSEQGAWREWLMFFLQGMAEQSHDASQRVKRLDDLRAEWHRQVMQVRASSLLVKLVDALFETPVLTVSQAQGILQVKTYNTARDHVMKLVDSGILQQTDLPLTGKAFIADRVMEIVRLEGD